MYVWLAAVNPFTHFPAAGAAPRARTASAPLRFNAQLATIRADLVAEFWHPNAVLVVGLYGE